MYRSKLLSTLAFLSLLLLSVAVNAHIWFALAQPIDEELIHVPWRPRPVVGGVKTIIILAEFQDVRFESSLSSIEYFVESANTWFRTSSYGKMYIDYTIFPYLLQLPLPMSSYGAPEPGSQRGDSEEGLKMYYTDVIDLVSEQTDVDLANFKDIVIIHSGGDEAVTGNSYDIWSQCIAYGPVSDELGENGLWITGKDERAHNIWGVSTFSERESVSIFIHEYAHSLGLPDLYIYGPDGYSEGTAVSFWSNMDSGALLDPPSDIDGWGKYILGWINPILVEASAGEYIIHTLDSDQDPKVLIKTIPDNPDQYYLIHARRRAGTDAGLPADGVLVFRIDATVEKSYSGAELALMEDANPGTLKQSGQYYFSEVAMHYELLDAPYNNDGETYYFSLGSIKAEFFLENNLFWDKYSRIAFLAEPIGDGSFKVRFGRTPEELGVEAPLEEKEIPPPSGCLIATATYGSDLSPAVQALRGFRDNVALSTFAGARFMKAFNRWYYTFSPEIASLVASHPGVRIISRYLIGPLVKILQISTYVYRGLSFNRELGIISTGIVASGLIGASYFSPFIAALLLIMKK
ncbi:hypothetical protein KEJ47_10355, partial [Candidatus Bathyarchaeota archaeon]|nr:hypothetical protein [Candidatus Bathyarchaeota archaeon]